MEEIVKELQNILKPYKLHQEFKWFYWYYIFRGKIRKLVFYINPGKKSVIFGVSHWWSNILEKYPMLKIVANETKKATIKWEIKTLKEIENKWISEIIKLCLKCYLHKK